MCSDTEAVHTLAPTPDIASGTLPPVIPHQAFGGSEVPDTVSEDACNPQVSEEETLESHEVIELQAFSERKAWIEEKIKVRNRVAPFAFGSHFISYPVLGESSTH